MAGKPLTVKQSAFVDEYLVDLNATQAAIRAGYSARSAKVTASRTLTNANVVAELQKRMAERAKTAKVSQDRVIEELALVAFSNLGDFVEWGPSGIKIKDTAGDLNDEQKRCVAEVSETRSEHSATIRFKLHDKIAALDKLARHLGLYMNSKDAERPKDYVPLEERLAQYTREEEEQRAIDEAANVSRLDPPASNR